MRAPVAAYVGIGANLNDPAQAVRAALAALDGMAGTRVVRASRLYVCAPVDAGGPDFVNAVAQLHTALHAYELLARLQQLEAQAGRERPYRNAPRTLDLDLLLYGSAAIASATLIVPHPRMRERAFVLVPLAEIAADLVTPEQLAAVASQRIAPLPPASLPS